MLRGIQMVTRRAFVLRCLAVIGTMIAGCAPVPIRQRLQSFKPLSTAPNEVALNGWVKIRSDNAVVVIVPKAEMGQGIHTALAMLVADEIDADWDRVVVESVCTASPIDSIYNNVTTAVDGLWFRPDDDGLWKRTLEWSTAQLAREGPPLLMITGGSSSMKDLWGPMRLAGASARERLINAAAAQWNVSPNECHAEQGFVRYGTSERSASFAELSLAAAKRPQVEHPTLKVPSEYKLIGRSIPRIEARSKAKGDVQFGIDVIEAGMLYASVRMCPTLGGTVESYDTNGACDVPGVMSVLKVAEYSGGTAGVAVIADTPFHAMRAASRLRVQWAGGAASTISTETVMRQLSEALDHDDGHVFYERGNVESGLLGAAKRFSREYRAPYLAHAPLEPMNCTVQVKNGRATVWVGTQVPGIARHAVAQVLDLPAEHVEIRVQYLGGGFGRRLNVDFIAQAAAIARAGNGAPVQTMWTREEDMKHDFYRPACVSRFEVGFDENRRLVAWRNVSAGQSLLPQILKRNLGVPLPIPDRTTSEGAFDQPYEFPNVHVSHRVVDLPIPVGYWRAVGHSHHAFFVESFIDEAAYEAHKDPVAFRLELLRGASHVRHREVLKQVAELSQWPQRCDKPENGRRRGQGVALHQAFGSIVAQVAEVLVTERGDIRVEKVFCVIDCGFAVNPLLIEQQMESGIVFGLSAALHGEITIDRGEVQQSNYHDYRVLRMDECPAVCTRIIHSTDDPQGVGEPGSAPIAPAIANAVFDATGHRLRELPLRIPRKDCDVDC